MTRRKFLRLAATAGLELGAFALGGAYTFVEPHWLSVERVTVRLANLPDALRGLTIAQISDLHLSVLVSAQDVARAVNVVLGLRPSLVVVTGDYVTLSAENARPCAAELAWLRAPLGVYTILGNHDHWTDAQVVTRALLDAGLTVLRNAGRLIESNGAAFWLAGVDDVWERHADPRIAASKARAEDQDRWPDRRTPAPADGEGFLFSRGRSRWHGERRDPAGRV
jgi:predicted MPP superfamily phosphohydrolase